MGKTSEGRSKGLEGALKAGGWGVTRLLERRRMFIRTNLSLKGRVRLNKKYTDIRTPAGLGKKSRCEAVELCCPLLGNGQKTRCPWVGLTQTGRASPATVHADFIQTNQACHFYLTARHYNGFWLFHQQTSVWKSFASLVKRGSGGNSVRGALWPKFFPLVNTLTTKEPLTALVWRGRGE